MTAPAKPGVKPVPDGYHELTPYLVLDGAQDAIRWYERVLGAKLRYPPIPAPGGRVGHAELALGGSTIMLADEHPELGYRGPRAHGGTPVSLLLYVTDVDRTFRAALEAGAKQLKPVEDQFYGDRSGTLEDPFGHVWTVATHVEDVSPEELERRMAAMKPAG